ncbi:MAG: serB [Rhodospirillales bacterium]|nr:serB [Rhodospirillales bacterium]
MSQILTLIGGSDGELTDELVAWVGAALGEAGALAGQRVWLAPGRACDLFFTGIDDAAAEAAARGALGPAAVDLGAQPAAGRRKSLLVADMESTIIAEELLDQLGRLTGLGAEIAAITERAMRGEVDFAGALRFRVGLLAGQPASLLEKVRERVTLTPGARQLVRTMRKHGCFTVLVTGGFDCFAESVAESCGFDAFRANHIEVAGGRLTGRVREPVLDRRAKLAALEEIARGLNLPLSAAAAVGDGANDLPMLQAAGLGVAYRGKPAVAAAARFRIDHADLTGLLHLQGYRSEEICR